ncbi:MAG: site-specific DNA-methyltransferase, partial [Sulfuritalea sp.]|nr:site-specific DNA-methyltransferase [Sulfuritalea sp.]
RVTHTRDDYPVDQWQKVASPVWMDINPSDTLQYQSAREHDDERHICPLQLEVIRRGVDLWTNPGDVVLSPFAGIGSEGHVSLQMGRKFIGVELKESYYPAGGRHGQGTLLRIREACSQHDNNLKKRMPHKRRQRRA